MKKILTSILIGFLVTLASAQDVTVSIKKSKIFNDDTKNSIVEYAESDNENGIILLRSHTKTLLTQVTTYTVERYDKDLKLIKSFDYDLKSVYSSNNENSPFGIVVNEDTFSIIDFIYEEKTNEFICYANTSKIKDFAFTRKELFRVDKNKMKNYFFSFNSSADDRDKGSGLTFNSDKTAFSIVIDIKNNDNDVKEIHTFDTKLNNLFNHTVIQKVNDIHYDLMQIEVSNDLENIYLIGEIYSKGKEEKKEKGDLYYEITKIGKNNTENSFTIKTNEKNILNPKIFSTNNKLFCLGFYADKKNNYEGTCFFELNNTDFKLANLKFNPFSEKFLIDKLGVEKKIKWYTLNYKNIYIKNNGEIFANAEETNIVFNKSSVTYAFIDIMAFNFNSNGEIIFDKNINKAQVTNNGLEYFSYSSFLKNDEMYYILNVEDKIKERSIGDGSIYMTLRTQRNTSLYALKLNNKGELSYKELIDKNNYTIPIYTRDGFQLNNGLYFLGNMTKERMVYKLEF